MRRTTPGVAAPALEVPLPALESDDEPRYKPIEWGLVKRLLGMLAPHKRQYTLAISLGLVHMLLDIQSPRFVQHIADYVGLPGIARPDAVRHILLVMLLWAAVFAGSVFLQRLTILFMTRAGEADSVSA